jgi:hypothetical protein
MPQKKFTRFITSVSSSVNIIKINFYTKIEFFLKKLRHQNHIIYVILKIRRQSVSFPKLLEHHLYLIFFFIFIFVFLILSLNKKSKVIHLKLKLNCLK